MGRGTREKGPSLSVASCSGSWVRAMTFRERTLEEEQAGSAKDGRGLAVQRLSCLPAVGLLSTRSFRRILATASQRRQHHPTCQRLFKCYLKVLTIAVLPLLPRVSEAKGLAPITAGLQPGVSDPMPFPDPQQVLG